MILQRYWFTIKYLKPKQIWYRIYYAVLDAFPRGKNHHKLIVNHDSHSQKLTLTNPIPGYTTYLGNRTFRFLNLEHQFKKEISWNFSGHGKLWTYNLNYFDFLGQPSMSAKHGLELILEFSESYSNLKDGLEPYPTSLRIINFIKFVSLHGIENKTIDQVIFTDLKRLQGRIEYHLLGNHLLENSFALFFGAFYFKDTKLYNASKKILTSELNEQILDDGAHFELSPMYHNIILGKILDTLNLISNNKQIGFDELSHQLNKTASRMISWLDNISFANGDVPHVNDSTKEIAPEPKMLKEYARTLGVNSCKVKLKESGYRKIDNGKYELFVDIGAIGPNYIPGHAHSDSLSFVLHHRQKPLVVDTGISTYEKNVLRQAQRSTAAHNTVMVEKLEQSEVWGGFRVARRATTTILEDEEDLITASHDGYATHGVIHSRSFQIKNDELLLKDRLNVNSFAQSFIHFHPGVTVDVLSEELKVLGEFGSISFHGATDIKTSTYQYAVGYNKTIEGIVLIAEFNEVLETSISLI